MPSFSCTVDAGIPPGLRLDRYAAEYLKVLSRSQIKARNLEARLNGKAVKVSRPLRGGEHLELSWTEAESSFLTPENLPLDVVYEDNRVIVVNKAQGMVVHPGAGNWQGTLANALLYRRIENGRLSEDGVISNQRPGIVHRLDKDTSGLIIAAWDDEALAFLSEQFKARTVNKTYAALVLGCPREEKGRIDRRIIRSRRNRKVFTVSDSEGRASLTFYKVIRSWGDHSLLLIRPKTGRTHQIRIHLKSLGTPIMGDPLYGREESSFKKASLMLHAKNLSLVLPSCHSREARPITFKTALPERFQNIIRVLNGRTRH